MKRNYLLALCFMLGILSVWGQEKIQSSFWGCSFGTSQERLLSALESDSLHPMQMEQGLLLKDAELSNTPFQTLAFMFSPLDGGLYKVCRRRRGALHKGYEDSSRIPACKNRRIYASGQR